MENVLIFGANGQIGRHLVDQLKDSDDYNPIAFVRKEEQVKHFEDKDVEARLGNLEDLVDDIKDKMDGVDSVVFTAGSGGSTGPEKTALIDLDGAVKTMEASVDLGINRYVIVSAFQADDRSSWKDKSNNYYYVAKHFADRYLENSDLDYTILRPGLLTNVDGTGKIQVVGSETQEIKEIPRPDVAQVILQSLGNDNTINKGFDLIGGDTDISDALSQL